MRDNEALPAIFAFLCGVAIMAAAIGAFVVFVGEGPSPKCLDPDACREATLEFAAAYHDPDACKGGGKRICLVPLGDVPKDLVDHLVQYYSDEYGLTLRVLPAVELEHGFEYGRQRQLEAQCLQIMYTDAYPQYTGDPNILLIGLTAIDIYTPDVPEWRWFFGYLNDRSAVISSFRMDPVNWEKQRDDELRNMRVRTLMNKYVALGYYGLQMNNNPHSVLYHLIGGLDTLDGIDERIPVPARR